MTSCCLGSAWPDTVFPTRWSPTKSPHCSESRGASHETVAYDVPSPVSIVRQLSALAAGAGVAYRVFW